MPLAAAMVYGLFHMRSVRGFETEIVETRPVAETAEVYCSGVPGLIAMMVLHEPSDLSTSRWPESTALPLFPAAPDVRFGLDLFSIRSQNWDAFQYLDYAAKFGIKVVHFSEIRFIGSLEDEYLKKVRAHAEKLGSR